MDTLLPVIVRVLELQRTQYYESSAAEYCVTAHWNTHCKREPFSTRPIRGIGFVGKSGPPALANKIPKKVCRTCCSSISSVCRALSGERSASSSGTGRY